MGRMTNQAKATTAVEEEFIKNMMENAPAEKINKVIQMQQAFNHAQTELYGKYNFDWDRMTIEQRTPHGWLRPMYMLTETFVTGRWKYWLDARALVMSDREAGKKFIKETPIPQIPFYPNHMAMSMLEKCIDNPHLRSLYKADVLALFVDWLLYGFGSHDVTELPNAITTQANDYWYREFRAQLLVMYPDDYLGTMAADMGLGKNHGYFPTPMTVVKAMTEMTMGMPTEATKYQTVQDPCLGSGRMLLCASNYSLKLYGQDINLNITKVAKVNAYLYVPWMIEMDNDTDSVIEELRVEALNKK